MRYFALCLCFTVACCVCLTHGRAEGQVAPSLTEDATALGILPKHGWVTADKLTIQNVLRGNDGWDPTHD